MAKSKSNAGARDIVRALTGKKISKKSFLKSEKDTKAAMRRGKQGKSKIEAEKGKRERTSHYLSS